MAIEQHLNNGINISTFLILSMQERMFNNKPESKRYYNGNVKQQTAVRFSFFSVFKIHVHSSNLHNNCGNNP